MPDDFDFSVSEKNGFTKEQIARFEIVLLFKQIEKMLLRFYEPSETTPMIEAMIYSQDKIHYSGINRVDDDLLKKFLHFCETCNAVTYHHLLSYTKECTQCGRHRK